MTPHRLEEILARVRGVRIGVAGDFCLDAYWELGTDSPEISLETGKATHAVRSQRYAPGGAGNVACNLASLGCGNVRAFGVTGPDLFGRELSSLLRNAGVDASGLLVQERGWETQVYAKPYAGETEQERIDFGRWNTMRSEAALADRIRSALPALDSLVVNQQMEQGIQSPEMIRELNALAVDFPRTIFIVDARTKTGSFHNMICKLNAAEALRQAAQLRADAPGASAIAVCENAKAVSTQTGKPVFVTRGAEGIALYDGRSCTIVPPVRLRGPVDTVGSGDAALSGIAAALAAGATLGEAAELGNLSGAVTATKLKETGTASASEILELARRAEACR